MGNGPNDEERRKTGDRRKTDIPPVEERRAQPHGRRERDRELEALEAIYYNEVRGLGRKLLALMKRVEQLAETGAKTALGLQVHVQECTDDAKVAAEALSDNTKITKKISDHQDHLVDAHAKLIKDIESISGTVNTIGAWAEPKINAEKNAERFWKMAGDAISSERVSWVWKMIAVSAGFGVVYLFGGKEAVAWIIHKAFGG